MPGLLEVLSNPQLSAYRPYYALALLKIDPQAAKQALPTLLDALNGKGPVMRLSAEAVSALRKQVASALGHAGHDAIPALASALGDADAGVRQEAAKALGEIGTEAREAVPSLRKALNDPDEIVRSAASLALKRIGG